MNEHMLDTLSRELENLVRKVTPFLMHIGGENVPYRTGIVWDKRRVLTTAVSAAEGEPVTAFGADGETISLTVRGFDGGTGLVLLKSETDLEAPGWEGEEPRVGALGVTAAFPSPAGPEARLEMARCVGDGYFQTDGSPFPGFSGAAVLGASGKLWGVIVSNTPGNRGLALPFAELEKLVGELERSGSRRRPVLGVRTQPVEDGLLVTEVAANSAAREAGLLVGDILRKLGETELKNPFALLSALERSEGRIALTISRGGKELTLEAEPHLETETTARRRGRGSWCGR
jgi:S1-C subfamily serine protease